MPIGKILITGATGNTGSGIAGTLLAQGHDVRILVRDTAKAQGLKDQGAEVFFGDLDDATSLKPEAFAGVERMYFCTWNGPTALQQSKSLLKAVVESGATPIVVRASAYGSPASRIIQQVEEADNDLKRSGLKWTILQPTFFMQNLMMTAPTVKEQGKIYWDWNDGKAGMIDVRDVVDSAVGALSADHARFHGQSFILTGPESVGFADVAKTMTRVLGKDVQYVPVPHEAAKQAMVGMGFPEWIVDGFMELNEGFTNGFADIVTDGVQQLSGHPARSVQEFVTDFRAAWED